jgi:hypothetical protein
MVSAPPRIQLLPSGVVSSLGEQAAELVGNAGLALDDWQRAVLHGGLGVKADESWAADEVVLVCPRQNGKTALAAARLMLGLYRGEQVLYTSHRVDSAGELFAHLVALVRASPELEPLLARIIFSNGREAIHLKNGGRCLFGTRSTSRTGRGFSLDAIVLDEAHYVSEESLVALGFTGYARDRAPQRWYLSSAVDRDVHEHGLTMSRLRERAIQGDTTSLAYFEWSAAVLDADGLELECSDVTPDMVDDEALWYQANPALGGRVPVERVHAERESMPHRGFLTERLGIGAWWPTVETVNAPLTAAEWAELEDRESKRDGPLVLAFDIDPDRRCALVACGRRGVDDLLHVELLRSASGTSWLRDELERLSERYDVEAIVTDGYGGNLAMVRTLDGAGLRVRTLTGGEQASACAKLLDLVQGREFRHIGQGELLNALRGAKAKPLGDAWAWSRKNSTGDIAAVIAMTLALAVGSEIPAGGESLQVF